MSYEDYTAADARRDEAEDSWNELIADQLRPLVDKTIASCMELRANIDARGFDEPHPWTWYRHLLWCLEDDEDALREMLDEHYYEEAEEVVKDNYDPGPCCRDYSCPCGNTNSFRGL